MIGAAQETADALRTVGRLSDLDERGLLVIEIGGTAIGVIKHRGKVYAYRNSCPHQGGPVAEGSLVGNVECRVMEGGARRESVSTRDFNIACPWHGIEYDLDTGVCRGDPRMRLKSYEVVVQDGLVKVRV